MRQVAQYNIYDAVAPLAITSSTNATPVVVTKASHGLVTGDVIVVIGHATNTNANGIWMVEVVTSSTFKLLELNGDNSVGNGTGGGTGIFYKAPKIMLAEDFRHIELDIDTAGSANLTVKLVSSNGKSISDDGSPDFAAVQSASNRYDFLEMIDLEDQSTVVDGDSGLAPAGTDDHRHFEANTNGQRWMTLLITAWSAGTLTASARLFRD